MMSAIRSRIRRNKRAATYVVLVGLLIIGFLVHELVTPSSRWTQVTYGPNRVTDTFDGTKFACSNEEFCEAIATNGSSTRGHVLGFSIRDVTVTPGPQVSIPGAVNNLKSACNLAGSCIVVYSENTNVTDIRVHVVTSRSIRSFTLPAVLNTSEQILGASCTNAFDCFLDVARQVGTSIIVRHLVLNISNSSLETVQKTTLPHSSINSVATIDCVGVHSCILASEGLRLPAILWHIQWNAPEPLVRSVSDHVGVFSPSGVVCVSDNTCVIVGKNGTAVDVGRTPSLPIFVLVTRTSATRHQFPVSSGTTAGDANAISCPTNDHCSVAGWTSSTGPFSDTSVVWSLTPSTSFATIAGSWPLGIVNIPTLTNVTCTTGKHCTALGGRVLPQMVGGVIVGFRTGWLIARN